MGFLCKSDFPADRAMQSRDRAHQRGLARAVGAQHRDQFAVVDAQVDALQHWLRAVARVKLADFEQWFAMLRWRATWRSSLLLRRRDKPCARPDPAAPAAACLRRSACRHRAPRRGREMPITIAMSCSTSSTAMPDCAMRRSSAPSAALSARDRPAAGSSSSSTAGRVASARAISTRRRSTCGRSAARACEVAAVADEGEQ